MTEVEKQHVEWCRRCFAIINNGGAWAIPRSGMIFRKQGNEFILTNKMPWADTMPITARQLKEQQQREFEGVQHYFGLAGVTVKDATGGENDL